MTDQSFVAYALSRCKFGKHESSNIEFTYDDALLEFSNFSEAQQRCFYEMDEELLSLYPNVKYTWFFTQSTNGTFFYATNEQDKVGYSEAAGYFYNTAMNRLKSGYYN